MFFVYIIENINGKKYTGYTSNLYDRLAMHNDVSKEKSRFHRTTYNKGPWKIIFQREFETREEALRFEIFLKTGKGRERARHGG
ncbi:MAG: Excinuclease ABC C subunit protein [uncultured bacterium]|nr:MAG: Excinuclease ABC C subunit protein [uncultured bacterium]